MGLTVALSMGNRIREKRDVCDQLFADFDARIQEAYEDYKTAFEAGDDGRPDWQARKACNYMTASVEDCGNMLIGDCATEEELDGMRDHQLKGILMQLQQSITEWDSEKCPTVKAHVERLKSQELEEVDEDVVENSSEQDVVEDSGEVVDKDSSEVDVDDSVEEVDEDDEDEDQEE